MRIKWQDDAIRDLLEIRRYIAMENPLAARKVAEGIASAASKLTGHPTIGRLGRVFGTRELVVPGLPYIMPYRVEERELVILRVLHTSRRWPEAL